MKFRNFLCTYDIVFLSECWIDSSCDISIENFVCKAVPLSKKKYKQGCGIYVMIRESISKYVTIENILSETMVWLKVSKQLTCSMEDYLLCNLYIPPQNSSFYKIYNCDLFYELESLLISYSQDYQIIF